MILDIYTKDGIFVKTVIGNVAQCYANVGENEIGYETDKVKEVNIDEHMYETQLSICNKSSKNLTVGAITVMTTSGHIFDGDEKSQDRMLRAINIASITGQTSTQWKLADNSIVEVTLDELKEALTLAGQDMSRIWLEN